MSAIKEKMIAIINSLPDDQDEDSLVEEFLTKLMLEKSKEEFEKGQYVSHESVRKEFLDD